MWGGGHLSYYYLHNSTYTDVITIIGSVAKTLYDLAKHFVISENIKCFHLLGLFVEWRGLSLIPKSILAGTKNSHSEGFWLAKHKR